MMDGATSGGRVVMHSRNYFLKSARVGFDVWSLDDLPLALALWGDPAVTRLIGGPFSPEKVEQKLRREIATMDTSRVQYWPIFLLHGIEHIGCCGLRPYQPEKQIFELGFHLRPAHWGKGLAEEAARSAIAYAFETFCAQALFAGHHPDNAASRRVLEKLGFRFAYEELYPPTGQMHPGYLLVRPENSSVR